jgi:hypothetical protein
MDSQLTNNLLSRFELLTSMSCTGTMTSLYFRLGGANAPWPASWVEVSTPPTVLICLTVSGDYDGDHASVIWDEDIVSKFTNADLKYADEPPGIDADFEPTVTSVVDLLSRNANIRTALQPALLGGRYDPNLIGIYSKYHTHATYRYGYGSDKTWRLAYM